MTQFATAIPEITARPVEVDGKTQPPRLRRADVVQLATEISVMLETGVLLVDALDAAAKQATREQTQIVATDLAETVRQGEDFSNALARHPRSFPKVFVALVKAGERSGMMSEMLDRATIYLRDEQEIVRKVKGALTYPAIMLSFAMTTTIFMLAFVLPRFTALYAGKEHLLPKPTKALMAASNLIVTQWHILIPSTAIALWCVWWWLGTPGGRRFWHSSQLNLPLLGKLFRKLHLSRGLRVLGTLAAAGVNLLDCIETARELTGNERYRDLWQEAADQVSKGEQLSVALRASDLVPASTGTMIASGEKAGRMAEVAERVAGHAETELKQTIAELTRYIEPAMIVLMGVLIGGVTMAMLLPVFTVSRVMAG